MSLSKTRSRMISDLSVGGGSSIIIIEADNYISDDNIPPPSPYPVQYDVAISGSGIGAAPVGFRGEKSQISASGVSLVSGTPKDIATVTLQPGEWLVMGGIEFIPAATTSMTQHLGCLSTQATNVIDDTAGHISGAMYAAVVPGAAPGTDNGMISFALGAQVLSLTSATTVRVVGQATFTVSTCVANAVISYYRLR